MIRMTSREQKKEQNRTTKLLKNNFKNSNPYTDINSYLKYKWTRCSNKKDTEWLNG